RQDQMDHVERRAGLQRRSLVVRHHVERRRDRVVDRDPSRVEVERPEGPDGCPSRWRHARDRSRRDSLHEYTRPMADVEAKTWVRDLAPGHLVDSTFAVLRKDLRRARTGAPFLSLELGDRTGRVRAVCFDDVALLDGRFAQGDTVRVLGAVEEYRGRVQVIVRSVERVEPGDPLLYVPGARRDTEDLEGFLESVIAEVHDSTLRSLVEAVYADARFRPLMRHAPVTIDAHHAYAGGAIQHTVAVATICREVCQLHPRLDESVVAA